MAARWARRAVAGIAAALPCMNAQAGADHMPVVRPALEQKAVTVLFLQLNS